MAGNRQAASASGGVYTSRTTRTLSVMPPTPSGALGGRRSFRRAALGSPRVMPRAPAARGSSAGGSVSLRW